MTTPPYPTFSATHRSATPQWAIMQRFLIDEMGRAAEAYVDRYTDEKHELVWRDQWPGMDGSDDGYEAFTSFPLLYVIGGSERVHELARRQWDAVTNQFMRLGQVHNEFDAYYDWMHHGESSLYFYFFGLADPHVAKDRARALRFAGMYMGEDPAADNWDAKLKMIKSPINGSRGARASMSATDWVTHRPVLAEYLAPYEDLDLYPKDGPPDFALNWNDDAVFAKVLAQMNERMTPGDVPLNLTATSLITNAWLYTGDDKYKTWVLEYLDAWKKRTARNGGITPDNVGPGGKIGEKMNGKWWGGYYGWRWPHGSFNIIESQLIAASNAALMTGDLSHFDLPRSQLDMLWALGRTEGGLFVTPKKHGDKGWFQYSPPDSNFYIHLYYLTQTEQDRARLEKLQGREKWRKVTGFGKGGQFGAAPWHAFVHGENDDYPRFVLEATYEELSRRMEVMRNDNGDPAEWDVHHWQDINPVVAQGLAQLTMGTPGNIYHGGLLHTRVRHFDPAARRAGLPRDVAALVDRTTPDSTRLTLVNTGVVEPRDVLVQAGAFGEHEFTSVSDGLNTTRMDSRHLLVRLAPGTRAVLNLGMRLHAGRPTYAFPWESTVRA
ncbi:MAG: hypothetical protein K8S99_14655 [Planctomycetes bacterium]|nr:hypothetical protein [Planctomycetota bacterium]